jgi:hypothetical protein
MLLFTAKNPYRFCYSWLDVPTRNIASILWTIINKQSIQIGFEPADTVVEIDVTHDFPPLIITSFSLGSISNTNII